MHACRYINATMFWKSPLLPPEVAGVTWSICKTKCSKWILKFCYLCGFTYKLSTLRDRCSCFAPASHSPSVSSIDKAMHDAYEAYPVLEKLPLQIECITCFGEYCIQQVDKQSKKSMKLKGNINQALFNGFSSLKSLQVILMPPKPLGCQGFIKFPFHVLVSDVL